VQKSWQKSDVYLDDVDQIEKVLRTLSKGLVEITQANPGGDDSEKFASPRGILLDSFIGTFSQCSASGDTSMTL
jgi:hypothetical protein